MSSGEIPNEDPQWYAEVRGFWTIVVRAKDFESAVERILEKSKGATQKDIVSLYRWCERTHYNEKDAKHTVAKYEQAMKVYRRVCRSMAYTEQELYRVALDAYYSLSPEGMKTVEKSLDALHLKWDGCRICIYHKEGSCHHERSPYFTQEPPEYCQLLSVNDPGLLSTMTRHELFDVIMSMSRIQENYDKEAADIIQRRQQGFLDPHASYLDQGKK